MTTARELVLMAETLQRKKTDAYGVALKLAGMGKAGGLGSATLTSPGASVRIDFELGASVWFDGTVWCSRESKPHW